MQRPKPRERSAARVFAGEWDWFPLQVVSGKENVAQILLEDRGLATFCPRRAEWRNRNRYDRARRQKRLIEYPWLPGLVFVGMRWPYPWHALSVAPVLAIISPTPEQPRPLAHEAIWRLMRIFGSGQFVAPSEQRYMETGEEFKVGDKVRVAGGGLSELTLEVRELRGRVAVVFGEMFGATRGFEADIANLRPVD